MLPLYKPADVLSARNFPAWILLASAAGAVNAIAFLACARFVAHISGNATSFGTSAAALDVAEDYGLVLLCFVGGATLSGSLIDGRNQQKKQPLFAAPLFLTVLVLVAVGIAGMLGVWGEFSGSVDGIHDLVFVSVLSFAMGVQNAAVASATGLLVRTTHMTGPATDLGVQLATALHATGETRKTAFKQALLRFTKITSFTVGAALSRFTKLMSVATRTNPAGTRNAPYFMSIASGTPSAASVKAPALSGTGETIRDAA